MRPRECLQLGMPGTSGYCISQKFLELFFAGLVPVFSFAVENLDNGQNSKEKTKGSQSSCERLMLPGQVVSGMLSVSCHSASALALGKELEEPSQPSKELLYIWSLSFSTSKPI